MVIVWRLRGNIIRTVLYIANVLPLQWAQLSKTVHTARLGLEFVFFCVFLGCMICLYAGVCFFYLRQLSHFSSCCAGVTNLNEPPSSFLLSPRRCGLGVGSIPLRSIVIKKQCKTRGLIYVAGHPLLNRRCTRLPGCFYFPKRKLTFKGTI